MIILLLCYILQENYVNRSFMFFEDLYHASFYQPKLTVIPRYNFTSAILIITDCREILFCGLPHGIMFLSSFIKIGQLVKYLLNIKIQKYTQMLYKMTIFLKHFRRISNSRKIVYITISQTLCCWSVPNLRKVIHTKYISDGHV